MAKIIKAEVLENYKLFLLFDNGKSGYFDMSNKLEKGLFKQLKNDDFFSGVQIIDGALSWIMEDGYVLDLCPDHTLKQLN